MTGLVLFVYIVLMIIFLVASALIIRHAITYGYLSSRFKKVVAVFTIVSIGVIIFSIYLIIKLFDTPSSSSPYSTPSTPSSSSEINF
ncbi:hypothetical protein KAR91_41725 [Candidatus Pacearchaeota archaeon]|nr:hypothetical protein [Candidatus Pacearchaeota archaeon]